MVHNKYRNYKFKNFGETSIKLVSDIFSGAFPYNSIAHHAPPELTIGKAFNNSGNQNFTVSN